MPITFVARVICDRPGCDASAEFLVRSRIEEDSVTLEADYPIGAWHELYDQKSDRWWVECPACYADPERFLLVPRSG